MESNAIVLSESERVTLEKFVKNGVHNAHLITRARVVLELDRSGKNGRVGIAKISEWLGLSRQAVYNIRNDFLASAGVEDFLKRKKREVPPVPTKITGEIEAIIVATACSEPPKGYGRWSVRLLASRLVELDISYPTVHRVLKKLNLSLT
jgi:hypothetical protein